MKSYLPLLLALLLLASCQSDKQLKKNFAGTYEATIRLPQAEEDAKDFKKEMEKNIRETKDDIHQKLEETRQELDDELGDNNKLRNALRNFTDNMGNLVESLTDLGGSLGDLGAGLKSGLLEGLHFKVTFSQDGEVIFGEKKRIRIGSDTGKWDIVDGKFYLWEDGENNRPYEMKNLGKGKWDLVGEKVIFHIERVED